MVKIAKNRRNLEWVKTNNANEGLRDIKQSSDDALRHHLIVFIKKGGVCVGNIQAYIYVLWVFWQRHLLQRH